MTSPACPYSQLRQYGDVMVGPLDDVLYESGEWDGDGKLGPHHRHHAVVMALGRSHTLATLEQLKLFTDCQRAYKQGSNDTQDIKINNIQGQGC